MVAVVDYGVGNLFSLSSSLKAIGADVEVTGGREKIEAADKIILPGVGAFSDAKKKLDEAGLTEVIIERANAGVPLMGICLGMQLLFEKSFEYGEHDGLGLIKGRVIPMQGVIDSALKIPHIGWNALHFTEHKSDLFKYINENDCVYFVHSFFADECKENTIATSEYSKELTAAVQRDNVYGCQFHPEKSGEVGLKILKAFCETEG